MFEPPKISVRYDKILKNVAANKSLSKESLNGNKSERCLQSNSIRISTQNNVEVEGDNIKCLLNSDFIGQLYEIEGKSL